MKHAFDPYGAESRTSLRRAYTALERLAQRATDLDAGRLPNKLAAFALAVRRAEREGEWKPLDRARRTLAALVDEHEAAAPGASLTALLREALEVVSALDEPPPPTVRRAQVAATKA